MEKYSSELNLMSGGVNISVRVGIYENADIHMDIAQRFDRAVTAAGRLRTAYKSTLAFYDEKVSERELFNEKLIMEMDTALENKQFQVYYQPKYDITGDSPRLASAEALIRWKHPEHGLISPGVFIPLFEENGLVQKLDRYVWSEAAAQIAAWREKFNITLPVSVNVSRMDIYDPKLIDLLTGLLEKNRLEAKNLLLEITESAYTDNSDQIIKKADALRDLGFRIEMDDFGSGYSSLNMLAALPVDALKLDMQFVRHITHDPKSMKMVELILEIADFLSVPVIAEGVETKEQYSLLKNAGCNIIQGYYFSKPLPAEEFEKLFEK
jgi:EAL domain-containing protein (putative c-di-GMP-specific phosphodiesterase class I)